MGEQVMKTPFKKNYIIRWWILFLPLVAFGKTTEIYEGTQQSQSDYPYIYNSSMAFNNVKCEENATRYVIVNFTMRYLLTNDTVFFNLSTTDGYTVISHSANEDDDLQELFLLGTSYINSAIKRVRGEKIVVLRDDSIYGTKAEFNIDQKTVIVERKELNGTNKCVVVGSGSVTKFSLFLDDTVEPGERDSLGMAPLHWATMFGDLDVIKKLLELGSDVNVPWTRENATPLHLAAVRGDKNVVRLLVENGGDVDAKDDQHMSIVDAAIFSNQSEIVEELIKLGANLTSDNPSGRTPLHLAAQTPGNKKIIEILLDNGADINAKDVKGRTPLQMAVESYDKQTVKLLVDRGAEVNLPELVTVYGREKAHGLLNLNTSIVE